MSKLTQLCPDICTMATLECPECDREGSINVSYMPPEAREQAAIKQFEELGWVQMKPANRDYIGPVCPECAKVLTPLPIEEEEG